MPLFADGTSSNRGDFNCSALLFFASKRNGKGGADKSDAPKRRPRLKPKVRRKSRREKPDLTSLPQREERSLNEGFTAGGCLCLGFAIALLQDQAAGHYTRLPLVLFLLHANV